jgi:hypothetical protein
MARIAARMSRVIVENSSADPRANNWLAAQITFKYK